MCRNPEPQEEHYTRISFTLDDLLDSRDGCEMPRPLRTAAAALVEAMESLRFAYSGKARRRKAPASATHTQ